MPKVIDAHSLQQVADWSIETFGPGDGWEGVIDHIKKEIDEVEKANGSDLEEWMDIVILAMDGARKGAGASPQQIIDMWHSKMLKNMARQWPDWRTAEPGKAIEHIRD